MAPVLLEGWTFANKNFWRFVDVWTLHGKDGHLWIKCKHCTYFRVYDSDGDAPGKRQPQHNDFKEHFVHHGTDSRHRGDALLQRALNDSAEDDVALKNPKNAAIRVVLGGGAGDPAAPKVGGGVQQTLPQLAAACSQRAADWKGMQPQGDMNKLFHAYVMDFFMENAIPFAVGLCWSA